jgi:hypothetical protein
MYLMILFLNSRKIARVHVSYRAFSRVWAFLPIIGGGIVPPASASGR